MSYYYYKIDKLRRARAIYTISFAWLGVSVNVNAFGKE